MKLRYGSAEEAGMSADRIRSAERCISDWVHSGQTQASAILAARKGIIVSHKTFGKSGNEENAPDLTFDTLFPLSSISKTITATAAMILNEEGRLDINKPIKDYIPEFTGDGKDRAEVCQLMMHTTGMNDEVVRCHIEEKLKNLGHNENIEPKDWLRLGYDAPLWKKPGEEMSYCNYGINILGEIVERVSGKCIHEFTTERIFDPLGMTSTFYIVPQSEWHRVIRRNKDMAGGEWFVSQRALESQSGAGGVYSTMMNMAIFCQMYANKGTYNNVRILKTETVAEMTKNQIPGISARLYNEYFKEASWGYCWDISGDKYAEKDIRSPVSFSHGGFGRTFIMVDPVYDLIFLCFYIEKPTPFFDYSSAINDLILSINDKENVIV